nr:glycine betaine/L-proline ABC transporter ATP-binding protein [Salsipaludibacter albus]
MARQGKSKDEILAETGQVLAVNDVSFDVDQGEMFVVMGLSGSGKSTVIRMLNRLIEPTSGTVDLDGERISDMSMSRLREVRAQKMSMVFQHFALFPHRTVGDNAAYGLKIQGVDEAERRERAEGALARVGLSGWFDRYPSEMSGGMKQRVGIARGLATDADILLMDEPFSALDPLIRRDMQDLLMELQAELSRTVVFITHDLNEAMRIGDRIVVMKDGAVVQVGTGEEIIHDPATTYVADFVADVDRSRVLTASLAMHEPSATFGPDATPREVLDHLDTSERNGVYVVDDDNRVLGVARDQEMAAAMQANAPTIRDHLVDAYATASPDTLLDDLSAIAARHTVSIAVIDDEGHLLGTVPRPALLRALAGDRRMDATRGSDGPARDQVEAPSEDATTSREVPA